MTAARRFALTFALALVPAAAGCVIGALDVSGKSCDPAARPDPCAPSATCDPISSRCVVVDAGVGPVALVSVTDLRVDWATPNSLRWVWAPAAARPEDLSGYQILVSTDPNDFSHAIAYTSKQNPELARYQLPGAGGIDVVTGTITDGLTANTSYYAKLIATDTMLQTSESNVAAGLTSVETGGMIPILTDSGPPAGSYPIPDDIMLTTQGASAVGSAHYAWTQSCTDPDPNSGCYENLRWQHLGILLADPNQRARTISAGAFPSAFLELWISTDSVSDLYWSELYLQYGTASCSSDVDMGAPACHWAFSAWTIRADGQYRKIQIPLAALKNAGGTLASYDQLSQPLYELGIGADWSAGAHVSIDEVSVKW